MRKRGKVVVGGDGLHRLKEGLGGEWVAVTIFGIDVVEKWHHVWLDLIEFGWRICGMYRECVD